MRLEAKKYLYDIQQAASRLKEFTSGATFQIYLTDALLRSGVERQLEIVGEALNQLAKLDAGIAARITGYRRIIAFRNILIHGYAEVDHRIVWGVVEAKLPKLREEVALLLAEDE